MITKKEDATESTGVPARVRKDYASPQLVIYGNISEITRSVGMNGGNDGGKGNDKSSK